MSPRDVGAGPRGTLKMGSGSLAAEPVEPHIEDEPTPIDAPRFDFDVIARAMLPPEVYRTLGAESGVRAVVPPPELLGPEVTARAAARAALAEASPANIVSPVAAPTNGASIPIAQYAFTPPAGAPNLMNAAAAPSAGRDSVVNAATELAKPVAKVDTSPGGQAPAAEGDDLLRVGDQVGPYLVVAKMAEGGMGEIYEVRHTVAQKTFALKALKRHFQRRSDIVERLIGEAKLMMDCRGNPNICEVQEIANDPRIGHFIVMEKLQGKNLADVLNGYHARQKSMDLTTAMGIALHTADALHLMHQLGAIHRDIKPENIFLVDKPDGGVRVVILDWGAAKSQHFPKTTDPSMTIATLSYMSPEQVRRRRPTAASDQYSLAFVIYEMLYEHPFADSISQNPNDPGLLLGWHLHSEIEAPPSELCPAPLFKILARAMNKEPAQRYPSMRDFAADIRMFLTAPHGRPEEKPAGARRHATIQAGRGYVQRWKNAPPAPPPLGEPKRRIPLAEVYPQPSLLILSPVANRGMRFDLGARGVIGRHPEEADLIVPNDTLSNRHAKYTLVPGSTPEEPYVTVEDLGSKNGTFLRDAPCDVAVVRSHEPVRLGEVLALIIPAGSVSPDMRTYVPLRTMATLARGEKVAPPPVTWLWVLKICVVGATIGLVLVVIFVLVWRLVS